MHVSSGLKCRWCGFTTPTFTTTKEGQRISGWHILRAHQITHHFNELEHIRNQANPLDLDASEGDR